MGDGVCFTMDYSKFDNIVDSDEEEAPAAAEQDEPHSASAEQQVQFPYAPPVKPVKAEGPQPGMQQIDPATLDPEMQAKLGVSQVGNVGDIKKMRKQYTHNGHVVY